MSVRQPVALSVDRSPQGSGRLRILARNRYQLAGATLVAVLLPVAVRAAFGIDTRPLGSATNTIVGTFLAMLFGAYLLRRMTVYPGVRSVPTVVPAFLASYGIAVAVFFFLRLDYSRFQFLASFLLALLWFGFIGLVEPRLRRQRMLVVPGGRSLDLLEQPAADWIVARSPTEVPAGITGVVADFNAAVDPQWERLLARSALAGLPVYHWKQVAETLSGRVQIERLAENNLGSLLPSSVYFRFKRAGDLALAVTVLPFAAVLCLAAAVAIKIEDRGPVLFRQRRVGFRGEPFTMLKFRSMKPEAQSGSAFTAANDTRVTHVGAFLRRYRIDELPQIVHVLRGEMSWIGPRPEAIELAGWYESRIPFYAYRHIVRPGISGWAQVNQGNVAEIPAATGKLQYDFFYIKYFSPWLDLLIAAKTVRTILTGFGSR